MNVGADKSEPLAAIHTDLGAIFVSLELSRSSWLITSLSPGGGEKMSKHSVPGGDFARLMERFAQLQEKARLRTGQSFRIIVIQEAGLDGFWIHRALQNEGIESHVVDAASIATSRRRRRAKTDKIDGETLVRALLAYKRGEPRVCAMVKAPTPGEEDRRHLCRERKALIAERVRHVNRIKGFLFSQGISGYQPLRRDRRQRREELQTGDGRAFPQHLKALINRELDRLELLLKQIKTVEAARDALLAVEQTAKPAPAAMLLDIRGIGPEFAAILWSEGLFRHFENRTADRSVCGSGPDTLAERRGRSRTGSVQSRQPATANNIDPTRLAMAAQSAALSSQHLVSRAGKPQRGTAAQNNHRCTGAKATGRALEIRDRRCRYRGRYDESCLTNIST